METSTPEKRRPSRTRKANSERIDREIQSVAGEINLLDYWRVIWNYAWLIMLLCAISASAALVFSRLSPKIYDSTATILIPREGAAGGLLSMIASSGLMQQVAGVSVPSLTPNRDLFLSILKSRLIAKKVVEKFNLKELLGTKTLQETIEAARDLPEIFITKEGVIEVKVEHNDPKMAAEIANFYVEELDRLVTQFGTTAAGRQRRFIAEQLERAAKDLQIEEDNLRRFQERNRAILLGDMANSMGLPGTRVPRIGIELSGLMRDLRVQEAVYTFLTQQLEQAKIAEAQDMPVVQILDRAVPAVRHSKPRTKLNMLLAAAVSLFIGALLAFFLDSYRKQQLAEAAKKKN
jgi:uncharacterized protein involved in exopolysaccharide biosynthesis